MNQTIVSAVFPVFNYVMRQLNPLPPAGSNRECGLAHYNLKHLVNNVHQADVMLLADGKIPDKVSGLHYLLASWVDEIFILHSPWNVEWEKATLTARLAEYKSQPKLANVRHYRVPMLAWEALEGSSFDILEVYLLVFHLGFGGYWPDDCPRDKWLEEAERAVKLWEANQNPTAPAGGGLPHPTPAAPAPLPVSRGERSDAALAARFALAWLLATVTLAGAVAVRTARPSPHPPAPIVVDVR